MFSETTRAKLEFCLQLIYDIQIITDRHKSIDLALEDVEGRHALMMCIMQIGESLSKVKEKEAAEKLPVSLAYKMRNIIAHDYAGVNTKIVKATIESDIPDLKDTLVELLQ